MKINSRLSFYLYLFIPTVLFSVILAISFYLYDSRSRQHIIETSTENHVELQRETIALTFQQIISDLKFLSEHQGLMDYLDMPDTQQQQDLELDYLSFSRNKKIYDQVRFLDKTGQEKIRVNFNNGIVEAVSHERLQNKGKRYYFMDSYSLQQGDVFVSPFDLNIEKGQIEQPIKPMIRFGIPVYDRHGNKRGIVLVNYLGKQLLARFRDEAKNLPGGVMLLNRDGYSLSSGNEKQDWSFMYPQQITQSFANNETEIWKRVVNQDKGQFKYDNELVTFNTVNPFDTEIVSSSGSVSAYASSQKQVKGKDYFWKIISIIKEDDPALSSNTLILILTSFTLLITVVTLVGSWTLTSSREKIADKAEQLSLKINELKHTQKQLIQSETMASLGRMVAGFAHEVNTPVGIAIGASSQIEVAVDTLNELLKQDEVEEEEIMEELQSLQQATQLVLNNLNRATRLIGSFKRTSVDQTSQQFRQYIPSEVIDDVLNSLKNKLKNTQIQINVNCPDTLKIKGQPGFLDQLLTNLILNSFLHAFDYGKKPGIIDISVILTQGILEIEFKDNGSGMDQNTVDKIFEPFFTTDRVEGTGLGLYICYNIISNELKGNISCESEQGQGTRYDINFPVES